MSNITQDDRDAAQRFWDGLADDSNSWGHLSGYEKNHAIKAFAAHRRIHLTDAMIEAGIVANWGDSTVTPFRLEVVTKIFNAMMGAR